MKQTYEQRVRTLAEKMAKDVYPRHIMSKICSWDNFPSRFDLIERYKGAARIAVAEMAEEVKGALFQSEDKGYWNGHKVNEYLKEQGLMPDAQEAKCPNCNSTNSEKMVRAGFCVCKDCRSVFKCNPGQEAEGYAG